MWNAFKISSGSQSVGEKICIYGPLTPFPNSFAEVCWLPLDLPYINWHCQHGKCIPCDFHILLLYFCQGSGALLGVQFFRCSGLCSCGESRCWHLGIVQRHLVFRTLTAFVPSKILPKGSLFSPPLWLSRSCSQYEVSVAAGWLSGVSWVRATGAAGTQVWQNALGNISLRLKI